jgi:hypothetical protein
MSRRAYLGCCLAGGAGAVALTVAVTRCAQPSLWSPGTIAVTLVNAALFGFAAWALCQVAR